ncbi:unnamed protein product, partial [Allacma fusca]
MDRLEKLLSRRSYSPGSHYSRSRSSHSRSSRRPPTNNISHGNGVFSHRSKQSQSRFGESPGNHSVTLDNEDSDLECLGLIGAANKTTDEFSDPINSELAASWTLIATAGLSDQKKAEVAKTLTAPSNCQLIGAPKLNPELRAGINISDYSFNRDKQFASWQHIVAGSLSELGKAMSATIQLKKSKEISSIDLTGLLTQCSSASQLMLHLQHSISTLRRQLIASNLNNEVKKVA